MNKVASGELDTYLFTDLSKGKFVAVYAQDPEENCGLPFWIGKVHELQPPIAEKDSDDEDITEEDLEGSVTIHECIQSWTQNVILKFRYRYIGIAYRCIDM